MAVATATVTYTCWKCNGTGKITTFSHVDGGRCFQCQGQGKTTSKPRAPKSSGLTASGCQPFESPKYPGWTICQHGAYTFVMIWTGDERRGEEGVAYQVDVNVCPDTGKVKAYTTDYRSFPSVSEAIASYGL